MPEHAEPREFELSEFQRSAHLVASVLFSVGTVVLVILGFGLAARPAFSSTWILLLSFSSVSALLSRLCWVRRSRPFARLSLHGLTINDGLSGGWSGAWTQIYAIEPSGLGATIKLAGLAQKSIPLSMLEREERKVFVEAVRKWIYSSH